MPKIRVGTRGSLLALTQTRAFVADLQAAFPDLEVVEVQIQTLGDVSTEPLNKSKTPGLFVSALRDALLKNEVDFIVHSMKDLPAAAFPGIVTACVPKREDARDGLVSKGNLTIEELPKGAIIGTSSPRRSAAIVKDRPDLVIEPIRGNVDTRIEKVRSGHYDATILAMAGLNRIGRGNEVCQIFDLAGFIPAAGQGALSVECRTGDTELVEMLATLDNEVDRLCTTAERAVLLGLSAGCATAIGAIANYQNGELTLIAELGVEETGEFERVTVSQQLKPTEIAIAKLLGLNAAEVLKNSNIFQKADFS